MNKKIIQIGNCTIGLDQPTYFIADIAANHDGKLLRAIDLINRCAEAGANAAKFQNFKAETIVSDIGFKSLVDIKSHQTGWEKSVYDIYDAASISLEWTSKLKEACDNAGIDYFTSPYDLSIIDSLDNYVAAWKIGSGDITWHELIAELSKREKPLLIATGASSMSDVKAAMEIIQKNNDEIVLMQCNTNYTASLENFKYINLSVISSYLKEFPHVIQGLSDHTPGHTTVLGAITLGARVVEKHFTDDITRTGPDHKFSMDPSSWKEMVVRSRELEEALGNGVKKVEENEAETVVLQRRALRTASALKAGTLIDKKNVIPLRPCPADGLAPSMIDKLCHRVLKRDLRKGELVKLEDTEECS